MFLLFRGFIYLPGNPYITWKTNFTTFSIFVLNSLRDVEYLYLDGYLAQGNISNP